MIPGTTFRERARLKKLIARWVAKFEQRPSHEQEAIYAAFTHVMMGQTRARPCERITEPITAEKGSR